MSTDDPIARRRAKRARRARARWVAAAVAGLVLLAGVAVAGVAMVARGKTGLPVVDRASWTHRDLADYLRSKGVEVEMRSVPDFGGPGRPVSDFLPVPDREQGSVRVYLCADGQAAREEAGSWGKNATAWGRFAICSRGGQDGDRLYTRIKAALD